MNAFGNRHVRTELGRLMLWVRPDGLQARARRNAWSAMVADHQRRVERLTAERSVVRPTPVRTARAQA